MSPMVVQHEPNRQQQQQQQQQQQSQQQPRKQNSETEDSCDDAIHQHHRHHRSRRPLYRRFFNYVREAWTGVKFALGNYTLYGYK